VSKSARLHAPLPRSGAPDEAPNITEIPDAASPPPPPPPPLPVGVAAPPAVGVAAGAPTAHAGPLLVPVVRLSLITAVCMYLTVINILLYALLWCDYPAVLLEEVECLGRSSRSAFRVELGGVWQSG
jgi:hypothetical protein